MTTDVGSLVRKQRYDHQLTQVQLARRAHITQAYLSEIENNLCSPTVRVLQRIAKAMELSVKELVP